MPDTHNETTHTQHHDPAPGSPLSVSDLPWRLLGEHGKTISAMLLGAVRSLLPLKNTPITEPISQRVAAPSEQLHQAYSAWAGADNRYIHTLPPHLVCAKLTLPLVSRLTASSPYPLLSVLNQGARLQIHSPLPAGEPLNLEGRLIDASDDGYSARIHSRIEVGTDSTPHAMTVDAMAVVVLKKRGDKKRRDDDKPITYDTVARWQASAEEGQTFFWLTGDFNPIHTVPAFAKRTRFGGCIMHGYGAFAQTFEGLARKEVQAGDRTINDIETRFIQPLPLPSAPLNIQRSTEEDAQGYRQFRLIDDQGKVYQAGRYRCA